MTHGEIREAVLARMFSRSCWLSPDEVRCLAPSTADAIDVMNGLQRDGLVVTRQEPSGRALYRLTDAGHEAGKAAYRNHLAPKGDL